MDTYDSNMQVDLARLVVLVERHLNAELSLLDKLDVLNQALKTTLETSGSRGMTSNQIVELNLLAGQLSLQSSELKAKRTKTLGAINAGRQTLSSDQGESPNDRTPFTIRLFIETLDLKNRERLESLRVSILDRLTDIHATLIGNQAVMFYSYDFYRKMVAGLLDSNLDENQYSMTGQSSVVKPGNLLRKAC